MKAMKALLTRASSSKLAAPAPSPDEIDEILHAALRAPDHGGLEPWRFLIIDGEGLRRLADLGAEALKRREPDASETDQDRAREKLTRAPMVIALGGRIDSEHRKIPEVEQILSIGAGAMNVLNALHALGFAGKWVTGANAYDPFFAEGLGFHPPERFYGMIMTGTPAREETPRHQALEPFVRRWS
jgi:nitroreductase